MEIIGSFILAVIQSILFYGKEIGISMVLFFSIGNGIIYYILNRKNRIKNKNGFWLLIPIILLSSTYFIFANKIFYITNIFVLIILDIIMFAIVTSKKQFFKNSLYNAFRILTDTVKDYEEGIEFTKEKSKQYVRENKKIDKENVKKVVISLLVVFSIVGIVIILLSSADSVFANIFSGMRNIFTNIDIVNTISLIVRLTIIVVTFFIFLSFILHIQKGYVNEENKIKNNNNKYTFAIKLLLFTLNIVYLVFCSIQVESLFSKVNINGTFDYADYARTGFFQLMFVSFINFAIIIISNKYNENKEKIIKILNIFLVIFTIIIDISSMYRMHMYETEYGLTYLRTFSYIILLTEILTFIPIIKYILNEKFDFIKWVFIICVCVYCAINYINVEKVIINKNINGNISTISIDYEYISNIASEDSYSILEEMLKEEEKSSLEKLEINKILLKLTESSRDIKWQEFNISKWKMQEKNVNIQELKDKIFNLENIVKKENTSEMTTNRQKSYVYKETINENEEYFVELVDSATGISQWTIGKLTNNGTEYSEINTMLVPAPSKIKFFENGLGFLEKPNNVYCGKSELLITYDSGKTFNKIEFPDGVFTLSDSNGEEWKNCYDYFYLPTKEDDGTLTVLASGGEEGGYNQGKTRAKYISKDNGHTWKFVGEINTKDSLE